MTLQQFDLRVDPFPIVPDGPVRNWAGREELKEELIDLVKGTRARDIGMTEFVILHGELGAGKSHALRFLRTMIDDETDRQDGAFKSLVVYLEEPRVANKLNFLELYKYIIRQIGSEKIKHLAEKIRSAFSSLVDEKAAAAGLGHVQDKGSFVGAAIETFPPNDRNMIRLLRRANDQGARVFEFLSGMEACDGPEYTGKIDSDFMGAKLLSDFFRVLTLQIRPGESVFESVYLFIDEGEVLAEAKASESELVFNGLRELINGVPYRFGLVMCFSIATALIEAIMPNNLLKRLTRRYIEVPMLSDEDAVNFLRQQINEFRTPGSQHAGSFYPFSEAAIRYIVENQNTLTPRNLFIDCKRVLERSIRKYDLQPYQEITSDMAAAILQITR